MPYASSIQTLNDANGKAYAFLEDGGLLWQCQWNTQAQRWDKAQVVPGAYGGEKLQALLVDNLWPSSGTPGGQKGNTPGIVLAYRVGEGDGAAVVATLGRWGSDGQLSWSEPLQLSDSGTTIEEIALAANGAGGFQLVVQAREPLDPQSSATLSDATSTEAAASAARKDSELLQASFSLLGNEANGYSLKGAPPDSDGNPPPILTGASATASAPPATAVGGNSAFSRSDLQLAPQTSSGLQAARRLSAPLQSQDPGETAGNAKWSGGGSALFKSGNGSVSFTEGLSVGQTRTRWALQVPNSSPPIDWSVSGKQSGPSRIRDLQNNDNYMGFVVLERIEELETVTKLLAQTTADPSIKRTLGLVGSFGFGGYGSQSVKNDFGITWIREKKVETGTLNNSLRLLREFGAIAALKQERDYGTISGNSQTTYQYDSLANPLDSVLQKVKYTFTLSGGYERQVRERLTEGDYIQWSYGFSGGIAAKVDLKPAEKDGAMPTWLKRLGYAGGYGGALEGNIMMGQSYFNQDNAVDNLKRDRGNPSRLNTWLNKDVLNNQKASNGDPYQGYLIVQAINAAFGASLAAAPAFANLSPNITGTRSNYGFIGTVFAGGRYLYKGIAGGYANLKDTIQWYPGQDKAFSNAKGTSSWQNKLQFDAGLAFPFGVSVPVLSLQITTPAPTKPKTTSLLDAATPEGKDAFGSNTSFEYLYTPPSGSTLIPAPGTTQISNALPLGGSSNSSLQLFTLNGYDGPVLSPAQATQDTPVVLLNPGSGLLDGDYSEVPVMGTMLPGSSPTTLRFSIRDGVIVAGSVGINSPNTGAGLYLQLPQTTENSGIYALIPDVFSTGILPKPTNGSLEALSTVLQQLPVINVDTSVDPGCPLAIANILAIQPVIPLVQAAGTQATSYPNPTPTDNSLISYSDVAITISEPGSGRTIPLLNQATATVSLSNGTIVKVVLDQPLFFSPSGPTPASLNLTLDLQAVLGPDAANPTYSVMPQAVGLNNVVEDHGYSANPGSPANASPADITQPLFSAAQAVWLADGINDQLQATPSQGGWPVFNRVVVQSPGGLHYLNASKPGPNGSVLQEVLTPDQVSLKNLYTQLASPNGAANAPSFSAASSPTAITIAGTRADPTASKSADNYAGASAVFWVEADKPVIPQLGTDGSENYQAFLTSLYGSQRINYRIFDTQTQDWSAPNTKDLYKPTNAVIRNLKAFQVDVGGSTRTLLVWDETSIDAIKGIPPAPIPINGWIEGNQLTLTGAGSGLRIGDLISGDGVEKGSLITGIVSAFDATTGSAVYRLSRSQSVGSSDQSVALTAQPLLPATVLMAGFINPAAPSLQWNSLFKDAGTSTITTIPWDQANDIGLGIESLSVASQQVVQGDGTILNVPVLSWSENVRTPYVQSVLNDKPLIYLQFGDLQSGFNAINIGTTASSTTTGTIASSTGLDFTIASALPKSSASAVKNLDGTGVLSTGTGSQNAFNSWILNSTPVDQLPSSPFPQLTGSISGTTLRVTALSAELAEGDLLTGAGLLPDTQITAVLTAFDPATGSGTYTINQDQSLASTSLEALPNPAPIRATDLGLPYSSFSGSIDGTTLNVSQLNGSLAVGDLIVGKGVIDGTTISEVVNFDATTGTGSYRLSANPLEQGETLPASALVATPSRSVPYTIEFWTQLPAQSNGDHGAGLVAFGQPSEAAVGAAEAPSGWLLTANFSVARITYQQAAALGSQEAYDKLNANSAQPGDLFAWSWSLDATGANTTALGGNGGSNLYSNALTLTNLFSGQTIAGVEAFLANYGLKPQDLVGGDGLFANSIDLVPGTSLDFNIALDPTTGPVSTLNAISIDTASSQLNSGLVQAINANGDLSSNATTNQNLQTMFQALWNYQEKTGEAKVGFTLDPKAAPQPGPGLEQYGGYGLEFAVAPGPAISVNKEGQLVFDVADGVSITSAATDPSDIRQSPLPADLRDGNWHYVVATYLPDFRPYTINGVATQVPVNRGTASLYVDNQLVASASGVGDAYIASNINDTALLLANNVGGAIDQFALYNKALLQAPPLPGNPDGNWPVASKQDALAILKQLGYPATDQTTDPGAIASALTEHWRSRAVDPNNAQLATFSSSFTPTSAKNPLSGQWSQAAPLNPVPQPEATTPSATAVSLQQDLLLSIAPGDWAKNDWFAGSSTQPDPFNPGGEKLKAITVTLTPSGSSAASVTRTLSPEQVLIGADATLASLQPKASDSDLAYTFLSNAPALNLLISRKANNADDSNDLDLDKSYSASIKLEFADGTSVSNTSGSGNTLQTGLVLELNAKGAALSQDLFSQASRTTLADRNTALATAQVIEAAPLQLKYVDSGVVLRSASSQAAANSPATNSPATSFGQSQAYGWFKTSSSETYSGWLAIAQPSSANATRNPAGRVWIQYTGDFTSTNPLTAAHKAVSETGSKAPITWLNALANSNFSPEAVNLPLLNDGTYPASYGGLLIQADPTAGWGQNFGQTMLAANITGDDTSDLIISAPSATGGGKVVIIDGQWIQNNLTKAAGNTILNLANPDNLGSFVTVLSPFQASGTSYANDDASKAAFGWSLAVDQATKTLWIGAPNYARKVGPDDESVPIGAVYHVQNGALSKDYAVGMAGSTSTEDVSGPYTSYWGSQLGASLAFSADAGLAIGAPGVQASLLYSGTEQQGAGSQDPASPYGQGALIKIMLPTPLASPAGSLNVQVSSSEGTSNPDLVAVISDNTVKQKSELAKEESAYMQALKGLQTKPIAKATEYNNPAIQTAAIGSVYLFKTAADLPSGTLIPAKASATFYGPNPWNSQGNTDFGASLSFGDVSNANQNNILAIGAPNTGGAGAVYLVNTSKAFHDPNNVTTPTWIKDTNLGTGNLGQNQYLAHLTSALTFYGAEDADSFGNGLVNLGDTNSDGYTDLLIQAFNASAGAGNGYVIFGSDQLVDDLTSNALLSGHNPAVGSVSSGSIGQLSFADGRKLTIPILSELGHGVAAGTGLGSYGAGDVDADGNNDIMLGAGGNAQAYLTWGKPYLEAISNLQLQKLSSNSGYLLEGLATTSQGSLRAIGDFNGDGYGDFFSLQPGSAVDTVRIELGANTQDILADYRYNFYSFTVAHGTQVLPAADINGDGYSDIALFLQQNLSSSDDGNAGAGSTTGIVFGRSSNNLPVGSGFGLLAPVDPTTSATLTSLPGVKMAGGLTDAAPSVIAVGNTLYAAVKGVGIGDTSIWFTQSNDGGNTWNTWTNLSSSNPGFATNTSPSLTFFNNKLYLAYLNTAKQLELSSWDPTAGNPALWNTPTLLSDGSNVFTSNLSPQLIGSGNALAISWLDPVSNTLASSITTAPDSTIWTPADGDQGGGSSTANPALAVLGNTVYMARVGLDNQLYWTSSTDGGQSWADWQELPSGMTSNDAPSLAVVNGKIYLTYLGSGNQLLNITQLLDAGSNHWSSQTVLSDQHAKKGLGAVAIGERVNSTEGLAIYYVADNDSGLLLRTWSATPQTASSWSPSQQLNGQTASSPLAVTGFNGSTYLAYQGGTPGAPSTTAYITNASDPRSSSLWSVIATRDAGNHDGVGLSSNNTGLLLNTTDSGTGQQAIYALTPASGGGSWSQSYFNKRASASASASTASLLSLSDVNGKAELLMAVNDPSRNNSAVTSTGDQVDRWIPQQQLLERKENNGVVSLVPISASAAPTATLLNGTPVLAVNNNGSVNIYAGNAGGKSFSLTSSFTPGSGGLAGTTSPGITTTETGLAVSYANADGSINLQRLNFLQLDGTPVNGVVFNADGSMDTSKANLEWQGINLAANSGLNSALATVPLSVDGNLLLANVRNSPSDNTQIWVNAVPNLSEPDSTTWEKTSLQLPLGNGTAINPNYSLTSNWQNLAGISSDTAPAFATLNGVLYATAQGNDNGLWWSSSNDGGQTWQGWQEITSADENTKKYFSTTIAPSLAAFDNTLWLSYANNNYLCTISFDGQSWDAIPTIPSVYLGTNQKFFNVQSASLTAEDGGLSVYYVDDRGLINRTHTDQPYGNLFSEWEDSVPVTSADGNHLASSYNLAVTQFNDQTYIAYKDSYHNNLITSANPGTGNSWNPLSGVPQPTLPIGSSIGLTANKHGLVLSYADKVNNDDVVVLQQGTRTATDWTTSSTTYVTAPSISKDYSYGFVEGANSSLFSTSGTSAVLIGAINTDANNAINTAISSLTTTTYGDLNGDGRPDILAADTPTTLLGTNQQSWDVWSIRAAGDVNGNGVDDVLLSLTQQGPAYVPTSSEQPSALQTVLVDGSLFEVDTSTNSFRLDQLRTPLNPYNRSQLYDVASTSSSDYIPSLQNWLEPILEFSPGSLTAASAANSINPAGARSFTEPAVAISSTGSAYLVISGADTSGPNKASGLWIAYQQAGNWKQTSQLPVGTDASYYSPSATFYQGKLYIAYGDTSGNLHIAYCDSSPENASSADWHSYQVTTTTDESTSSSPTLVAEAGRLALYFPSNSSKNPQDIRYLYSTDPDNARSGSNGNWGSALDPASGGYQGVSGIISGYQVTGPIAATTFQGRTVLAFRSWDKNLSKAHILLLTQISSTPTVAQASPSLSWKATDTNISDVNGVGLTTDQALLYLTSSSGVIAPSSSILSLRPNTDGSWSADSNRTVGGSLDVSNGYVLAPSPYYYDPTYAPGYGVINPFVSGGQLMAAWTDSSYNIQVANLNPTVSTPSQKSLAGYSIDGNIDINGDGFMDMLVSDPTDPRQSVNNQYALFGGDYLNIASQVGTNGDDNLSGTPLADVIYSLGGSDSVISGGGRDVIYTGAGNDQISIADDRFIRIDAGSGFDQLQLEGLANQNYDFRLNIDDPQYFAGTKLRDIELISSIDYGINSLSFDAAAINAINRDRVLFLTPDASDTIILSPEFQAVTSSDGTPAHISYGGSLWSTYAAGVQTSAADSGPALVCVLNPNGASASDWLDSHVIADSAQSSAPPRLSAEAAAPASPMSVPIGGGPCSSTPFGDGLEVRAYPTSPAQGYALFELHRNDTSSRQVIGYVSSSTNSTTEAGRDYTAVAGVVVLERGQGSQVITVPINSQAFAQLKSAQVSLEVQQLPEIGQSPLHLLIQPDADSRSTQGLPPTLSGLVLTTSTDGTSLNVGFRADSNTTTTAKKGSRNSLNLIIGQRPTPDARQAAVTEQVMLTDEATGSPNRLATVRIPFSTLSRDRDLGRNDQISTDLSFQVEDGDRYGEVTMARDGRYVDANHDNTPDAAQPWVVALAPSQDRASADDYGAISVRKGLRLGDVSLTAASPDNPSAAAARPASVPPADVSSSPLAGSVSFAVSGLKQGGRTKITYDLPSNLNTPANTILSFNTETGSHEDLVDAKGRPLYRFTDKNKDGNPDSVILMLADGDPIWDGDGTRNGTLVASASLALSQREFRGTEQDDVLIGNARANRIEGRAGGDVLQGDLSRDIIHGGVGNDSLDGGLGADLLDGGPGSDTYLYRSAADSTASSPDTVVFDALDHFDFSTIDANTLVLGDQAFAFIGSQAFSSKAGELRAIKTLLEGDTDGDGSADLLIQLKADFVLDSQHLLL